MSFWGLFESHSRIYLLTSSSEVILNNNIDESFWFIDNVIRCNSVVLLVNPGSYSAVILFRNREYASVGAGIILGANEVFIINNKIFVVVIYYYFKGKVFILSHSHNMCFEWESPEFLLAFVGRHLAHFCAPNGRELIPRPRFQQGQ